MTKRIFKSIFLASVLALAVSFFLIFGILYGYTTNVLEQQLKAELRLAANGVQNEGLDYFDGLDAGDIRLTWIDTDGAVLYDSKDPDAASMENHLDREEVREALNTGTGESARYSSTLMQRLIYEAVRLKNGSILRVSAAQNTIWGLVLGMLQPLIVVLILVTIFSAILAKNMSEKIVRPINTLDLDHPLENKDYDELAPLFRRIHLQQMKLAEQKTALKRQQDELDVILGSMQEGMVLLKKGGGILGINSAAKSILHIPEAHSGQNLLEVSRNLEISELLRDAYSGENAERVIAIDGRDYRTYANPVFSENAAEGEKQPLKDVDGVTLVLIDITEQEKAEQMRREFTANVSHELKTPLHSISGYAELIKDGIARQDDVRSFAGKIYKEAQRTIRMVDDIINLSHLDEGAEELPWEKTDVNRIAQEVAGRLESAAADKNVSISLQGERTVIDAKAALVEEIIYNLCDNAVRYNVPGGKVNLSVYRRDENAVVTVADTGIGIPAKDQERIFERFYRVDKSRSRELGGTGLGLSIVKHAAKILNGKIELESVQGEGTMIRVRLPVTRQ